jgi:hypothetical protein
MKELTTQEMDAIFKKFGIEPETGDFDQIGLKSDYARMVEKAKIEPSSVFSQQELFHTVFGVENENLSIGDREIHFTYKKQCLTNFGAIVLGVKNLHEIERVRHEVEMLILSEHDEPRIINKNSLELRSYSWIEALGVSYRYEKTGSIQNAIKIMAQFAPVTKVYTYSGWAVDKPDTYILGGIEICAKNYHF